MSDWTSTQRTINTPNGPIKYGGSCKDDYDNFRTYDQGGGKTVLTLQEPAMQAFKAAEIRVTKKVIARPWRRLTRRERRRKLRHIKVLPGTNRTCSTQTRLYASDPQRYADPKFTGHCRGLAIDVDQSQPYLKLINDALEAEGWRRVRADEPWHWSYFLSI